MDFVTSARSVLAHGQERMGLGLWMVTRTEGSDWIVLQTVGTAYGIEPGRVFRWSDSLCARMVRGEGPRMAPDALGVRAYAEAPMALVLPIGAYVGVPIERDDGSLFGTLCAPAPAPQPDGIEAHQPLVELLARLLGGILANEMRATEEARRAERVAAGSTIDELTELSNRRAWEQAFVAEEARCRRHGHHASVMAIAVADPTGLPAGEAMLTAAAETIRSMSRASDFAAHLGGGLFGVLAVDCSWRYASIVSQRLKSCLDRSGVSATVGVATRKPLEGLETAWAEAQQAMHADADPATAGAAS